MDAYNPGYFFRLFLPTTGICKTWVIASSCSI
jgi:hypothetical protein